MPRYADIDHLINDYLPEVGKAAKPSEIEAVGRTLDNASAFVDSYCRRPSGFFLPNDTATEKRIRGEGQRYLRVPFHHFGSITEVKYGETIIDSANYYESDANGWLYAEENSYFPDPYDGFNSGNCFWDGVVYKVTAKYGYAETPAVISEVVRILTVSLWETTRGTLGQISPQGFLLKPNQVPPDLLLMLDEFRKREFEI